MNQRILTLLAAAGLLAVGGCSNLQPPKPWEKGDLARPVMRLDVDPLEARFSAHTYFSKEAAAGGAGVGGGGCGCN
jgi:hypothetical protein